MHWQTARSLTVGSLSCRVFNGALRDICFGGVEIVRGISPTMRDATWNTILLCPVADTLSEDPQSSGFTCSFQSPDGGCQGQFRVEIPNERRVDVRLELRMLMDQHVNRAGLEVLHPLQGTVGSQLVILHTNGSVSESQFPEVVRPDQPARNVSGLCHSIAGLHISLEFGGETFEMEDQRNWSDPSFKTYCRPLAWPHPYRIAAGTSLSQSVTITIEGEPYLRNTVKPVEWKTVRLPEVRLAHDPNLSDAALIPQVPNIPVLVRFGPEPIGEHLASLPRDRPIDLELVYDDLKSLDIQLDMANKARIEPRCVVALPVEYLRSHQPEGPWPDGPGPYSAIPALRAAFPRALVGAGSLTTFTELNRARPDTGEIDFITFANSAIIHAADDESVIRTLQSLPYLFDSAQRLAAGRPLYLGLFSIGLRRGISRRPLFECSQSIPVPKAMVDGRQTTAFAAAYAVGLLAQAAISGVESIALGMSSGPFRILGTPLEQVVRAASLHAGSRIEALLSDTQAILRWPGGGIVGNLSDTPLTHRTIPGVEAPPLGIASWEDHQ